jgi:hypothetical protein
MAASHLNYRERVIPALTDHMEDNGGVVGLEITAQLLVSFKYSFEVLGRGQTKPFADQRRPTLYYYGGGKREAAFRHNSSRSMSIGSYVDKRSDHRH